MSTQNKTSARVGCGRLVRPQFFTAPRGYAEPDGEYRSRFNFVWWFWLPRIHTQNPDTMNPRVLRLIWLCFAAGLETYGHVVARTPVMTNAGANNSQLKTA